jgi:hypothetical protein
VGLHLEGPRGPYLQLRAVPRSRDRASVPLTLGRAGPAGPLPGRSSERLLA